MGLLFSSTRWAHDHSLCDCEMYAANRDFDGGDNCKYCSGGDEQEKESVVVEKPSPTVAENQLTAVKPPPITYCPEPRKDDSSTKEGVMFEKLFDQTVELSRGSDKKLTESEILKAKSFDDLDFPSILAANIAAAGYSTPTPIQQYAMKVIAEGKDLIACSPTGSGKTAAFLLPILKQLLRDGVFSGISKSPCMPRALILVPTRELAIQIHHEATKFATGTFLKCEIFYGGASVRYQRERILRGVSVLIGTTDRIKQFISEGIISLERVKYLVIDEADRMFDTGLHFSEDLRFIMRSGKILSRNQRQTLLFSAALPSCVKERVESSRLLKDDHLMVVVDTVGAANKCIIQNFVVVSSSSKKAKLLELLLMVRDDMKKYDKSKELEIYKQRTLIFVSRRNIADYLGWVLTVNGFSSAIIHAGHEQAQRESALDDFRLGREPILIATGVAERGLDISGLDHVINFDMPKNIDDYVYRIGRTGRIGNVGHSTSFIDPDKDGPLFEPLANLLDQAGQIVPFWLDDMKLSFRVKDSEKDSGVSMSYPDSCRNRPRLTM